MHIIESKIKPIPFATYCENQQRDVSEYETIGVHGSSFDEFCNNVMQISNLEAVVNFGVVKSISLNQCGAEAYGDHYSGLGLILKDRPKGGYEPASV